MDTLLRYHGIDVAGFLLSFVSLHLLGNRRRTGFALGAVACVAWAVVSVLAETVPMLVANVVFGLMNVRAYVKWAPAG